VILDRARLDPRLGPYSTGPASALSDPQLWPKVQDYRRLAGARMTAIARDEIKTKLPSGELHVSRKVDGEFTVLVVDGDEAFTLNPGGTVRTGLPCIVEAADLVRRAGLERVLVAGELYLHKAGARTRVHDITQNLARPRGREELSDIRFAAFDLLEPRATAYADTWARLTEIFGGGTLAHPVEGFFTRKLDDVDARFKAWVEGENAEGVVVRSDAAGLFKIKNRFTLDVVVVGFCEGIDDRKGMLHDLLVAVVRPEGSFHVLTRVGGGFSDDERRSILSDLKDLAAGSDYTEVSPDHIAYQMVRPEWVIEISCIDLIAQTTRGGPIERMVLGWNASETKYEIIRRLPLAAVIAPNFIRRREDKRPNATDARLSQVAELVEIPLAERDARTLVLSHSELLRREVYTKVMRGHTMVRKLLLWKTNKERDSDSVPAFVLYLTDFSPNRRDALEREIRIGSTLEDMERMWDELKKEKILAGWQLTRDRP
jgi:hypothetical protein